MLHPLYRRRVITLTVLALFVASCANLSLKTKAVVSLQASMAATGAAQDYEISAYNAKTFASLNDQAHLAISKAFVTIFDIQAKTAIAVDAWRAGDPPPQALADYIRGINDALTVAKQVAPDAAGVVEQIQIALDAANKILTAMRS